MFGFLKNLLRKPVEEPEEYQDEQSYDAPLPSEQAHVPEHWPAPSRAQMRPMPTGFTPLQKQPVPVATNPRPGISVSLQPILDSLPLELQPKLLYKEAGDSCIQVPIEKILAQLSRGAIRLSFGELRALAPQFFANENDRDKVLVTLPLGEVLAKVNPAMLSRRRVQRQIEVPAEISSPFDPDNQGLIFSVGPAKPQAPEAPAPASAPTAAPGPFVRNTAPINPKPQAPSLPHAAPAMLSSGRGLDTFTATPQIPAPVKPAAPIKMTPPAAAIPMPSVKATPVTPVPAPVLPSAPKKSPVPQPTFTVPAPAAPAPVPAAVQAPAPVPMPAPKVAPQPEALWVTLIALAEGWPDAVRAEIVHLNMVDAKVGLPVDVVEQSLKQGKVAFTWKALRSYIKGGGLPVASPQDNIVLELPLKVVAPLFIARQREAAKEKAKVNIDAEIPNLFFGFPQPDAPNATRQADTNYYVWDDTSDTARVAIDEVKRPSNHTPGTAFISRCATPNEVVSRAAALDGVAGALIALPDGLMVASQVSSEINGDTLAAFLPQIFAKVTQCTRELRMGELNNLSFTVGNVPWKVFRVNAIFFAAFGKAGEGLPTAQLAALAGELDHKAK